MRAIILSTAFCQLYDPITLGDVHEQHEIDRYADESLRRHVSISPEPKTQFNSQIASVPTIRPREFANGPALAQITDQRINTQESPAASAALTSNALPPAISAEESLQFLHKLVSQGANQAEKLGKAFLSELTNVVSKREPFLSPRPLIIRPEAIPSQQSPSQMMLQQQYVQQSSPEVWSPPASASLASAVLEQSPVWPWWRSTTMFNEAMTRSAVDILTSLGYSSQSAIDGWFGVADEWSKVVNSLADFQQRLNQALWKFQGWTVRLLLPPEFEASPQVAQPTAQVLKPNLILSAELLASSAQQAGALEEPPTEVTGLSNSAAVEFLPLELSSYARH